VSASGEVRWAVDIKYGSEFLAGRYGPGPRDQRLEEFAQGRWADQARPSGWLALQVCDVSRPEVIGQATEDELLGIGRAWKSLETWSFTGKLAVVRELIRRYPLNEHDEPGEEAGGLPDEWDPRLHHEVAAALGISVAAAGKLVDLTWTLDSRLPGIGKAVEAGRLDPARVRMIVDETSVLDREDLFARAEAIILAGLAAGKTWADLQRLVQRAVITVDSQGARKRREQAEREHARIQFWRESTGTCALRGTGLPTDQALAATANIEARALDYKAVPIKRPTDILRVMAYLDLINGVTIAQRAAWAQAEDEARQVAADDQVAGDADLRAAASQARDKFRQKAPARNRRRGADPGQGQGTGNGRPDDDAHGDGTDGDGPDDECPDDRDDDSGPGGAGGGTPGGDDPDGSPGNGGGFPDGWPDDGSGGVGRHAGGDLDDDGLDDALVPVDPRAGDHDDDPCLERAGGGIAGGLPIRANLTLAAGAIQWLAQRSGPARNPAGNGAGSGGGGPGSGRRGSPDFCPACGSQGRGRMSSSLLPIRGNVTFPLLTLLGMGERPGEAHGLGALDAGLVRDLAAAGARHPASEFCVTITDEQGYAIGHGCGKPIRGKAGTAIPVNADRVTFTPSTRTPSAGGFGCWILTVPGAPAPFTVDIGPVPTYDCDHRYACAGYAPSDKLRHLVQVRDGTCSYPACSRHARESDFEHARPFDKGGRTCACNAHACSRSCHRVKQSPGWTVAKPRPGWTQWTTMTGRTYVQGPWRYPS
jgi:hypothetical protein